MTDGFLRIEQPSWWYTNDSWTRVDRLTRHFNSTSGPENVGSRSYIIVEQKVLLAWSLLRKNPNETFGPKDFNGRTRDEDSSIFPGTHRRIVFVVCFEVLACHDWNDYYIFLKEGTSVLHNDSNFYFRMVRIVPLGFCFASEPGETIFLQTDRKFFSRCVILCSCSPPILVLCSSDGRGRLRYVEVILYFWLRSMVFFGMQCVAF